jgi:hypothetical protein
VAFPIRKLCGRAALVAIMLAGGLVVASMTPADADDDVQAVAATPSAPAQVVATQNSPGPTLRGLAN